VVRETKAAGKTVLLVSHVLPDVEELADEAAVLVAGKIAWHGPVSELKQAGSLEAGLQAIYEKGAAE
jgi:ABC-2 type transport system ATP-binding protein